MGTTAAAMEVPFQQYLHRSITLVAQNLDLQVKTQAQCSKMIEDWIKIKWRGALYWHLCMTKMPQAHVHLHGMHLLTVLAEAAVAKSSKFRKAGCIFR